MGVSSSANCSTGEIARIESFFAADVIFIIMVVRSIYTCTMQSLHAQNHENLHMNIILKFKATRLSTLLQSVNLTILTVTLFLGAVGLTVSTPVVVAGEADVVDVSIKSLGDGKFQIDATVEHADTGWDHYANRWDVLDEEGKIIGSRELAHPHVNEQPFTRSVRLSIPSSVKTITVRANDSVHETGGASFELVVPHP